MFAHNKPLTQQGVVIGNTHSLKEHLYHGYKQDCSLHLEMTHFVHGPILELRLL